MSNPAQASSPFSLATQERGQRAVIFFNLFGNVASYIVVGQVMMLFATDVLQLSGKRVGIILAALPLLTILRLPLLQTIRRVGMVQVLRISVYIWITAVLFILLLPARFLNFPLYMTLLLICAGTTQIGIGSVWQPLLGELTRDADRGRFFARMRFWFTAVTTLTLALIPLLIGQRMSEMQYKMLLLIALAGGINRLFWARRIPAAPRPATPPTTARLSWRQLRQLLASSPLMRYPLLITALWTLTTVPIYVVYLKELLHMPSYLVAIFIWTTTLMQALSLLLWGRLSDAIGFRPMISGLLIVAIATAPLHLLLQPFAAGSVFAWSSLTLAEAVTIAVLLLIGMLQGFIGAGLGIALTSILHYYAKGQNRLESLNLHEMFTMLFMAAAGFGSGYLFEEIAMPQGSRPLFNGILHFDWIKGYILFAVVPMHACTLLALRQLGNARMHFTTADFFAALSPAAMRNLWTQRRLYHSDDNQRAETAHHLGVHVSPMGVDPLLELLTDPSYDVKVAAIRALARSNSALAADRLLQELQDVSKQQLADHVAWALGELHHQAALPALLRCLQPQYALRIRAMAARALGKLGCRDAITPLAETLDQAENSQHLRSSCCCALLQLDADAHAASILTQFRLLADREERYELAELFCRKLAIPSEWLLRHTQCAALAQALLMHIELHDHANINAQPIKQWLLEHDLQSLQQRLQSIAADSDVVNNAFCQALCTHIQQLDTWQASCVLTAAWLLLRPNVDYAHTLWRRTATHA